MPLTRRQAERNQRMRDAIAQLQQQIEQTRRRIDEVPQPWAWATEITVTTTSRLKEEDPMKITNVEELRAVKKDAEMFVKQMGTKDKVTWVADGEGAFVCDGVSLALEDFASAVMNGNVSLASPPLKVGDVFLDPTDTLYLQVIAQEGEMSVVAVSSDYGYSRDVGWRRVAGRQAVWRESRRTDLSAKVRQAFLVGERLYRAELAQERLGTILESGEIPPLVEYQVSVSANVYDEDTDEYTPKVLQVAATARWGCACAEVGYYAVEAAAEAAGNENVDGWTALGVCVPADGSPSTVHAAAEVADVAAPVADVAAPPARNVAAPRPIRFAYQAADPAGYLIAGRGAVVEAVVDEAQEVL